MTTDRETMSREDVVDCMQDLLQINHDACRGFEEAAEAIQSDEYEKTFRSLAQEHGAFSNQLNEQVVAYGGERVENGSVTGAAHRVWMDLRAALPGSDLEAVAAECARGQGVAEEAYDQALAKPLPPDVRELVTSQHDAVRASRDRMRRLRAATE